MPIVILIFAMVAFIMFRLGMEFERARVEELREARRLKNAG